MFTDFWSLFLKHGPHSGQRQLLEDDLHLIRWVGHISSEPPFEQGEKGPILQGIFGLRFIGPGIFVTDPLPGYPPGASSSSTVQGTIHNLFGQLQFISLIGACFVLARRDAADPNGGGCAFYSVATSLLAAVSDLGFVLTVKLLDGGPAGLISRPGLVVGWSWIALLAIRVMSVKVSWMFIE